MDIHEALYFGTPDWLDDVVRRYGLSPATH